MTKFVEFKKLIFVIAASFCTLIILEYSNFIETYQTGNLYETILKLPLSRYMQNNERGTVVPSRPIPVRNSTTMRYGPVYVFGAVGRNTTNNTAWDIVNVYGSLKKSFLIKFSKHTVVCCMLYKGDSDKQNTMNVQEEVLQIMFHFAKPTITTFHIVCPNVQHLIGGAPFAVSLSSKILGCDKTKDKYVKVEFPNRETGFKVAIGTQIAYKNINAELIIEWMETYKRLQVDKVVSYYHRSVNKDALKALIYYHNTGVLDLYEIILPEEDAVPRSFKHASGQLFNDLRLSVYDSFEKMSGYTYFGIIDIDEFLIPVGNKTIKEMLTDLQNTYERAAGYFFKTQYFYLDWGKSNNNSDLILGQFANRTAKPPFRDRQKNIYMPDAVQQGAYRTHVFKPDKNFIRVNVPSAIGFLRHFRSCRKPNSTECVPPYSERVVDTTVVEWAKQIENDVHLARKRIFETDPY